MLRYHLSHKRQVDELWASSFCSQHRLKGQLLQVPLSHTARSAAITFTTQWS